MSPENTFCFLRASKMFPEQQEFARRLSELRVHLDLSLAAFGKRIGYGRSYLSRLERGKSKNPSDEFLNALYEKIGVSRAWLAEGKEPMFVSQKTQTMTRVEGEGGFEDDVPIVPALPHDASVDELTAAIAEIARQLQASDAKRLLASYLISLATRLKALLRQQG